MISNIILILAVTAFISGSNAALNRYYKPNGGWEHIACQYTVYPEDCTTAHNDAVAAVHATEARYPGYRIHNDEADAFRHCYWSALMTIHLGVNHAKTMGDNHEALNTASEAEKQMDLYNNAIGLQVGLRSNQAAIVEQICADYARSRVLRISV